ncbi:DNA translocase FtsK, partial [bacterium M00.F.Ca.ET.156.01.1.1]
AEALTAQVRSVFSVSAPAAPAPVNTVLTAPSSAVAVAPVSPAAAPVVLSTEPPVVTVPGGSAIRLYREIGVRQAFIPAAGVAAEQEFASQPIAEAGMVVAPQLTEQIQ